MPILRRKRSNDGGARTQAIPILCKFWHEEGVWNGTAEDLAVAVFGETYDQAIEHMRDALVSHFRTLEKARELESTLAKLERAGKRHWAVNEIPEHNSFMKMVAAVRDSKVLHVA
jgi:hypothetical protein